MSEEVSSSATASEPAQPSSSSPPKKDKKKLWLMIVAVIVAILLISTAVYVLVISDGDEEAIGLELESEILPSDDITVDAGKMVELSVTSLLVNDSEEISHEIDTWTNITYSWSRSPYDLGSFNLVARRTVEFTATNVSASGTVTCTITWEDESVQVTADVTVNPPYLDSVSVNPSTKTLAPEEPGVFTASAMNSVGEPITGLTFSWTVSGLPSVNYTLSPTTGTSVTFTALVEGNASANLTATATMDGVTKNATAAITIGGDPMRTVDYYYYDLFNVPFGEWWEWRWTYYGDEEVVSWEYPYIFKWYGNSTNVWLYTNQRLTVTGRNMPEMNMNENPEFLPLFGDVRGGTAKIDWYMQYLTAEDMERYPENTAAWLDGWVIGLSGTVTLDRTAAMAVMGITSEGFDDFTTWWAANGIDFRDAYIDWVLYEGNDRLDIFAAYDYPLVPLSFNLYGEKVGDTIVLTYDTVTWGMEAMMFRWMKEAFMPVEWYMEDMYLEATIGPEYTDLDLDTAVVYAAYAYGTTLENEPCWMWEALMQDYVESNIQHPYSLFDVYVNLEYTNYAPGSPWYGTMMPYDYAPGAHNLSENETMVLEWPSGEVPFYAHGGDYVTINYTGEMTCNYTEPDWVEFPGQVVLDSAARTLSFEGPIDFWSWSKLQGDLYPGDTRYDNLGSEWDRLGGVLPYGCPTIEFRMKMGEDPEPTELRVEGITSPIEEGATSDVAVAVLDQYGAPYTMYTGTVVFTSDDAGATLPAQYTFQLADGGVKTFTDAVAFSAPGTYYVRAEDVANSSIYGEQVSIEVYSSFVPVPTGLRVEEVTSPIMEGVASGFTVTVLDQVGNPYDPVAGGVDYTGTVAFSSNDTDAELPVDYTFTVDDAGSHTWTAAEGVTFHTPGVHDLTAVDTSDATISGAQLGIMVIELHLEVAFSPSLVIANETDVTLTVTAMDQFGGVFVDYLGTVEFSSTDGLATIPGAVTFTDVDDGVVDVPGFMFGMPGTQTVTATDQADSTITGSTDVTVGEEARATYLTISGVSETCMNGVAESATVTAMDQYDRVFPAYDGTVQFSSSDGAAVLPSDYPFVPATDSGVHTFTDGVTFNTDGDQTLRCEDSVSGIFGEISVYVTSVAQEITSFTVEGIASGEWTGNVSSVTVTALDQYDNLFETYTGTVTFTTDATGTYTLPSDYTFILADVGVATLSGVSFDEPGTFSVTVADTVATTATGSQTGIVVLERPVATSLVVSGYPTETSAGSAISLTVTVYDQWDEVFVWYEGTVTFLSSDGSAVLPGDYTFTASDDGVHVFDTIVLNTVGGQTVTVTDTADSLLTATTDPITVSEPREVQFTVYDMFAEPWGAFWDDPDWGREGYYMETDILTRGTYNTMVYLPGYTVSAPPPKRYQGMVMAPYRLNIDGSNMPELTMATPVFMPVLGTGTGVGAEAQLDVYMQYLDETWWADYWVATWGSDPDFGAFSFPNTGSDGYELGTIYTVTMNREAAELWLGLPLADDVDTWWTANHDAYLTEWRDWLDYEANERLDIFNAFDWPYVDLNTMAELTEDVSGDVVLSIGHLNWGYETMMVRWLDDEGILTHQPWYEDLTLNVAYGEDKSDMMMDAVCQFNLHAVKANETTDGAAWVWESVRMDYIPSSTNHPYSEFDDYVDLSYQSWNAGDELFGMSVPYDTTPGILELGEGETLLFQLPTATDVLGYQGVGVPSGSYARLNAEDYSDFEDISVYGEMELGYSVTNPASPVDLASMYDDGSKTLTIEGPQTFDQVRWPSDALYHGSPWIEFNVVPLKLASEPAVVEEAQEASASSIVVAEGSSFVSEALYMVAVVSALMLTVAALGCNVRRVRA